MDPKLSYEIDVHHFRAGNLLCACTAERLMGVYLQALRNLNEGVSNKKLISPLSEIIAESKRRRSSIDRIMGSAYPILIPCFEYQKEVHAIAEDCASELKRAINTPVEDETISSFLETWKKRVSLVGEAILDPWITGWERVLSNQNGV